MNRHTFETITKPQLLKVKEQVLAEPQNFIMARYWLEEKAPFWGWGCDLPRSFCGTCFCIAGLICNNARRLRDRYTASELLGLPKGDPVPELFDVEHWPYYYRKQWFKTRSLKKRAAITGRRIDAFLRQLSKQIEK